MFLKHRLYTRCVCKYIFLHQGSAYVSFLSIGVPGKCFNFTTVCLMVICQIVIILLYILYKTNQRTCILSCLNVALIWEDCVKRDVKNTGEEGYWKKKTGDRGGWKRLADEAVKKLQAAPHP